jgi:hypothetical protein
MGYITKSTKGSSTVQQYHTGTNPNKKSIAERISFGTGDKNKQSPGFLEMVVKTIKKAID